MGGIPNPKLKPATHSFAYCFANREFLLLMTSPPAAPAELRSGAVGFAIAQARACAEPTHEVYAQASDFEFRFLDADVELSDAAKGIPKAFKKSSA